MPYKYRAGDIIHEDSPYAVAVNVENAAYTCSYCFGSNAEMSCTGCQKLIYCSAKCQENDAVDHSLECGILADREELPDEELRLVIRALHKFVREKDAPSMSDFFGSKRSMNDLLSHVQDLNATDLEEVGGRVTEILNLLGGSLNVDQHLVVEILMKCRINRYCLINHNEPSFSTCGQVVYLGASAIDHSCVINESYTYLFDGRRIILRALTDFTLDDPRSLRIHYLSSQLPYDQRRMMTLETYYFVCSCDKCVSQARAPEIDASLKELAEQVTNEVDTLYQSSLTTPEWYQEGLAILDKYYETLNGDFALFWLLTQLQNQAIEQGFMEASLKHGSDALRSANTVLSMEPILFNLCLAMKMLGWNERNSEGYRTFAKGTKLTMKLFSVSHGPKHPIMKTLQSFKEKTSLEVGE
ncbi:N-lysine methyltransferase SMYD2-A-like [Tropilaelaps mercedesae]|uniref:N-lysine methyltransferase SMYD2-A-like n=1 Tax=Tropilaelaps mercedesae TaxID=418985 RepID=A0A1V9X3I8_9ACAR|nr:N-lysine methyltransferase SMYD2-A-like [Tropilaelaps mercedesae]